jgi:prolyl oligopeptidase
MIVGIALPTWSQQAQPPKTRVDAVTETIHGVRITDPYRWLEDQDSPETRAWIDAETKYTRAVLDQLSNRELVKAEVGRWMRVGHITTPWVRGGNFIYSRRGAEEDQASIYIRRGAGEKEELLVNPLTFSADSSTSVTIQDVSATGKVLAYAMHGSGADEGSIAFLNTVTGKNLDDVLSKGRYVSVALTPDGGGVYYSDFTRGGFRVHFHRMGTARANDKEIFGKELKSGQYVTVKLSPDGHYLLLSVFAVGGKDNINLYIQDVTDQKPIAPLVVNSNATFVPAFAGSHLYLFTNWKAPNGRVVEVDLKNPDSANWREIVPESSSLMNLNLVSNCTAAGGRLFVEYNDESTPRIEVFDSSGKHVDDFHYPTLGSLAIEGIGSNILGTWEEDDVYYTFTSFAIPARVFRYNTRTRQQTEWARVDGPVDPDTLEIKKVQYESKDGTRVPLTLVYKKGLKLDGQQPTLLSGYGGFGMTLPPMYSPELTPAALWASNGGVFAWAGLRGGGEYGENWHADGMLGKKQNVFDDFISAAEWLIRNKYTKPERLAITGMSNGGLLVGAALTQRPDLFKAVVCAYPLLDMFRYQKFAMGFTWIPEYGSSDNPEQFKYLLKYSPYQNVKAGTKYPAVLFVSGDSDTRVAPLHARKMTALVQASTASDNPVLLRYAVSAGHVAMSLPVSQQIEELADQFSFFFWQLGMESQQEQGRQSPRTGGPGAESVLTDEDAKTAYAIAFSSGGDLHLIGVQADPELVLRGVKDGMSGKGLLTNEEIHSALARVETAKAEEALRVNNKRGSAFLLANKNNPGVISLPSGLQYKILVAGSGPKPTAKDMVVCNYRGTLIDGKEFDSSYKRGQSVTLPVIGVIKGWSEALQLMPVGSKWQLFLPPDLAYGDKAAGPDIGPGSTLIFEIELLSIRGQ